MNTLESAQSMKKLSTDLMQIHLQRVASFKPPCTCENCKDYRQKQNIYLVEYTKEVIKDRLYNKPASKKLPPKTYWYNLPAQGAARPSHCYQTAGLAPPKKTKNTLSRFFRNRKLI